MEFVRSVLRAEKARHNLSWNDLAEELARHGIQQSATNLSTKVARGSMSAPLFIVLLKLMRARSLDLQALELPKGNSRRG
jgi:hypothetical protein